MKLQRVFDALTYGDLAQLHIGGTPCSEGIREEDRPLVLSHIQIGLTALYTRFKLRECSVVVKLVPNQNIYKLESKHIIGSVGSEDKYLLDFNKDFDDSVLKIEEIYNHLDDRLILNDVGNLDSFITPTLISVQVPRCISELTKDSFKVLYRADHKDIDESMGQYAAVVEDIDLPKSHLKALLFHVAGGLHTPLGISQEGNAGHAYYAKYEQECLRLEQENIEVDDIGVNYRFSGNGFC